MNIGIGKSGVAAENKNVSHLREAIRQNFRNIISKPALKRPTIGKPPSYITTDAPNVYRTSSIVRGFDNQIDRHPERVNSILKDFLDEFYTWSLTGYEGSPEPGEIR